MNWKHWPLYLTLFAGSFFPNSFSKACGWDGEWGDEFYRILDPAYMDMAAYEPFHFTWDRLYSYDFLEPSYEMVPNIAEWEGYFKGHTRADIEAIVYKFSVEALEGLDKGSKAALSPAQRTNGLANAFLEGDFAEALDYLIFAKRCEPFCISGNSWGDAPANARGSETLVAAGRKVYAKVNQPFLQQRYAYQIVRLLRYDGKYQAAVEAYESLAAPLREMPTTIYWWTRSHFAGALRYLKRPAEAAYHFSRVFDACPTRRIQAYYSFRIRSEKQWGEAMALCQNGREKATLHFLRGITPDALATEEIAQVQALDPGSDQADVLLLREINKLENTLLSYPFSSKAAFHTDRVSPDSPEASSLANLQKLIDQTIASNKMHDPDLWRLAGTYVTFLSGKQAAAAAALEAIRPQLSKAGTLRANLLDLTYRIAMSRHVDASVENKLLMDLTNLSRDLPQEKANLMRKFMDEALAWLYVAQRQPAKALLARGEAYRIAETANIETINDLLKFVDKESKTLYEKQLTSRLTNVLDRNGLLELKGTRLLAKNLLPEAIKVFKALPSSYHNSESFKISVDPFKGNLRDIVNCDEYDCTEFKYTKLSFAEALLKLQKKAIQEPEMAAHYYHLLGNAYYNITYFGPAWKATDYFRSGGSWYYFGGEGLRLSYDPEEFDENINMELPWEYYEKSIAASKDPELAALSSFMAAKCELNTFYMMRDGNREDYQSHFSDLLRNYRNTQIYDQLIRECSYFRIYANTH